MRTCVAVIIGSGGMMMDMIATQRMQNLALNRLTTKAVTLHGGDVNTSFVDTPSVTNGS